MLILFLSDNPEGIKCHRDTRLNFTSFLESGCHRILVNKQCASTCTFTGSLGTRRTHSSGLGMSVVTRNPEGLRNGNAKHVARGQRPHFLPGI